MLPRYVLEEEGDEGRAVLDGDVDRWRKSRAQISNEESALGRIFRN